MAEVIYLELYKGDCFFHVFAFPCTI